jgi:ankyrin repeat protein
VHPALLKTDEIEFLRLLLSKGANPDHQLHDGSTALMRVSWEGNNEACEALLAAGAKVNMVAQNGWDALRRLLRRPSL